MLVLARAESDTINGGSNVTIVAAYGAYLLQSDGTSKWTAQAHGAAAAGGVSSVTCFGTAITTSGTCVVAATKSDEQAGTSTTAVFTPSKQQQHDSAVKAWVNFTGSTGGINASQCFKRDAGWCRKLHRKFSKQLLRTRIILARERRKTRPQISHQNWHDRKDSVGPSCFCFELVFQHA